MDPWQRAAWLVTHGRLQTLLPAAERAARSDAALVAVMQHDVGRRASDEAAMLRAEALGQELASRLPGSLRGAGAVADVAATGQLACERLNQSVMNLRKILTRSGVASPGACSA